jgi:hypothetical protein
LAQLTTLSIWRSKLICELNININECLKPGRSENMRIASLNVAVISLGLSCKRMATPMNLEIRM